MPRGDPGSWVFAADLSSFFLSQFSHLHFFLQHYPRIQGLCLQSVVFTYLRKVGGSYYKWVCVRTLGLILFWLSQAEETYLSAGTEGAREWTASPQCSFRPSCPLWGCLLVEAAGKPWQPGWHSACHNSVSSLCLTLVGIQETENGPSEVRYSCPQKVNILIIKHFLFCSWGGRKGLRMESSGSPGALTSGHTWEKRKAEQGSW